MKPVIALLAFAACCSAGDYRRTVPPGSAIYVDSKSGLNQFLAPAFEAHHLPLRIVSSPEKADYTLHSNVVHTSIEMSYPRGYGEESLPETYATVWMTTIRDENNSVWKYVVPERIVKRGGRSIAEVVATHIQDVIAKSPRP